MLADFNDYEFRKDIKGIPYKGTGGEGFYTGWLNTEDYPQIWYEVEDSEGNPFETDEEPEIILFRMDITGLQEEAEQRQIENNKPVSITPIIDKPKRKHNVKFIR